MKARPHVLLKEPIDYPRLAAAFASARWRWALGDRSGYPDAAAIQAHVTRGVAELKTESEDVCYSSGGIDIERHGGQIVAFLNAKLADHYEAQPPSQT